MLVGITGKIGAGKTHLANKLIEDYEFVRQSFAGRLKIGCAAFFNESPDLWDSPEFKEKKIPGFNFTRRFVLQKIGTEGGRYLLDQDIWVKIAMLESRRYKRVVFDDVRFQNEHDEVRKEGGIIVHIFTSEESTSAERGKDNVHASEHLDFPIHAHFRVLRNVGNNALTVNGQVMSQRQLCREIITNCQTRHPVNELKGSDYDGTD